MPLTAPAGRVRRTLALGAATVVGLVLTPATAWAGGVAGDQVTDVAPLPQVIDDGEIVADGDAAGDSAGTGHDAPAPAPPATGPETDDGSDPSDDGSDLDDAGSNADDERTSRDDGGSGDGPTCDDRLVTMTPGTVVGDGLAVAITAQAIDATVDGWVNLAWQAAEGTTLRAVLLTELDGTITTLAGADTGSAVDVLAVTFCGTSGGAVGAEDRQVADGDGSGAGDTGATDVTDERDPDEPDPDGSSSDEATGEAVGEIAGESAEEPEPQRTAEAPRTPAAGAAVTGGSDTTSPAPSDDPTTEQDGDAANDDQANGDEDAVHGVVVVDVPQPTAEPATGDVDDDTDAPDTEALGIQFSREDTGGDGPGMWITALVVLAAVGAAGVGRRSWNRQR